MTAQENEMRIFNCPHMDSNECESRLCCHPIPGYGSAEPEFLVLGINPGKRRGVWHKCDSLEELKHRYFVECMNPLHNYGKLLEKLKKLIPTFEIPGNVYISDVVKCPTRAPSPPRKMIEQCFSEYLERTVQALNPKYIIGLGRIPAKYVGGARYDSLPIARNIVIAGNNYWFISATHPSAFGVDIEAIAYDISKMVKEIAAGSISENPKAFLHPREWMRGHISSLVEQKLFELEYEKHRNSWVKRKRVVHIVHSSEFNERIRISWKETWKDDHAIIYDYSGGGGPTCIVPISSFFMSNFVKQKRRSEAYANSGYKWSQPFRKKHQLAQLVLSFEGRMDLL